MHVFLMIASKCRLTFARVCVQVNTTSELSDFVSIKLNGLQFDREIIYNWKLRFCKRCSSFSHDGQHCLENPTKPSPARGRSHTDLLSTLKL